ncbi:MAG TPA: T9SS type A sorting domain-containing protein [Bacteroidia bacterium]|nr:T9SS type A sorting domain-containing protein [Bacteroidia bacterium]
MKHKICLLLFVCLNYLTGKSQNLFVADYALNGSVNKSLICYDRSFFRAILLTTAQIVNVMKTDSAGNVLWSNDITYPNATFFSLTDIVQAADSGFLILVNWRLTGSNHSDPTVTKLDKNGNHLWTHTYISVLSAYGYGIIKNNDNGFIVVGSRQLVDFVMKCDATGSIIWIKQFGGIGAAASNYDIATHDYNRFVVTGRHGTMVTFFQIDLSGNLYWHTAFTYVNSGIMTQSLKPLSNGGYAATGIVDYTTSFSHDGFLLKTDSAGTLQWLKIYEANQGTGTDVAELPDSSLLMVGKGSLGGLALKTDKDGNFQFAKTETVQDYYASVNLYSPGIVMLSGRLSYPFIALTDTACSSLCNITPFTIPEYTPAYTDTLLNFAPITLPFADDTAQIIYAVHPLTTNVLCGFTSTEENVSQNETEIYPNPIIDKLNITNSTDELSEIILYDIASRKLLQQKFSHTVTLNTAQLAKGIYFYEMRNPDGSGGVVKKGKVVKE